MSTMIEPGHLRAWRRVGARTVWPSGTLCRWSSRAGGRVRAAHGGFFRRRDRRCSQRARM